MTETVTVPRELLRLVLNIAAEDNDDREASLEPGRDISRQVCQMHRARIAELRKAARLDDD